MSAAHHLFWITSRAAGGAALLLSSASVLLGLMMSSSRRNPNRRDLRTLHEALSLTALAMVGLHGVSLLGDAYLNPGITGIIVPFAGTYRPLWTGLGILAGYGLALLGFSYYLRDRIGASRWKRLHRLTALFWLLAIVHTIGAGSDAIEPWFLILNGVVIIPAVLLLALRWIGRASGEMVTASAMGQISTTMLVRLTVLLLVAAAAIAFLGCGGGTNKAAGQERPLTLSSQAGPSHTVLIVLENHELNEVIGGSESSALDELSKNGALAVHYYAVAHPSLPNYLALTGGSTFGISEDCTDCHASGTNLATQLSAAGVSWRAYMGSMPRPCFKGAEVGSYAKRHNPFLYFPSIASNPSLCAHDVPESELDAQLTHHDLPTFSWISPNLCNDAHSCEFGKADEYLGNLAPRLLRQLGSHGLLIITFDEGSSNAGCCGNAHGGRVATILIGAEVQKGIRLRHPYSHYSLLATLEDRLGVGRLREARRATPMTAAFTG